MVLIKAKHLAILKLISYRSHQTVNRLSIQATQSTLKVLISFNFYHKQHRAKHMHTLSKQAQKI